MPAGRHRAGRSRRGMAALLAPVILASFLVVVTIATNLLPSASAVELPPGGLVPSSANSAHTEGRFAVSGDGAATYDLPLWVPAGRGAAVPHLSLSYNSRAGNGLVGVGWSLTGLKSINQCPRTLAQDGFSDALRFDGTDVYCMGSDRLRPIGGVVAGQQEYRTDVESFSRIVAFGLEDGVPSHFEVRGRDGLVYTFGGTETSRHEAFRLRPRAGAAGQLERDSTTPRVIGWMVDRVEDRNNNVMTVGYGRVRGAEDELWWSDIFPSRIRYAPNREVRFLYDGLGDRPDGFAAGVHTRVSQRLRAIRMSGGPEGGPSRLLREYQLSFQNPSTTGRSLLTSVKECDGDGICKLPLELTWSLGGYFAHVSDTGADDVGHALFAGKQVHVLDINADGRDDVLYTDGNFNWLLRRSAGDGFHTAVSAGIPRVSADRQGQLRLADIDRDGRTDVLAEVPGTARWRLYRSNGSQFVVHPDNLQFDNTSPADPVYLVDLNGGGSPDILTASVTSSQDDRLDGPWRYRINDGTDAGGRFGPEVDTRTSVPSFAFTGAVADIDGDGRQELIGKDNDVNGAALGLDGSGHVAISPLNHATLTTTRDVNGDGLPDQLSYGTDAVGPGNRIIKAIVNSGNGGANSLERTVTLPSGRHGVRVGDFTGDGVDDVLFFLTGKPNGSGDMQRGPQLYSWQGREFLRVPVDWPDSYDFDESKINSLQVMDINGNGVLDFIYHDRTFDNPGLQIMKRFDEAPDRLIRIGNPGHSSSVAISYTTLGDRSAHTPCVSSTSCLTAGGSVVRQHVFSTFSSDPGSPADVFTHTYQGARRDLRGRGWLGVNNHTVARSLTGERMTTFFDNAQEPFGRAGVPVLVVASGTDRRPGSGGTIRDFQRLIIYERTVRQYPSGTHRWELTRTSAGETERVHGATGPWETIHQEEVKTTYDDFGNPRTVESTTTGGRRSTEVTVFRNNPDTWLLGLPERKTVTGCNAGNVLCETRTMAFDYDARGNQTVSIVEPDRPLQKSTTTTGYGQFGEIITLTRTDGAGRSRSQALEYDADRLTATATVATAGAIEHRTRVETHSGLGVALRTVDVNGVAATMRYDGFGRPREVHRSDGSFERIDYTQFFGQATSTTRSDGSLDVVLRDQLGRERQRETTMFDGRRAQVFMDYNVLGLVSRVSRPKLSSEVPAYTTTEYDLRGRVVATTAPDGARTRHAYAGLRTDSFTAMNKQTRVERNADGDIATSSDLVGETGTWLTTRFEYGAFGGTTKRVAPDSTTWESVSDQQTRRRETVTDPASGVTTTFYNAFGEVEEQTRAGNRTTTFAYDGLGRVTEVRSPDGVARNTWDSAPHGIGKLTHARSSDQIVTEYTYDDLGRPATSTTRIDGVRYQERHDYDPIGRPSTVTYPEISGAAAAGRLQVGYEYNQHGYLVRVRDTAAGGPVFWTAEERNTAGQLVRERFDNGVVTANGYQPATGLLTQRTVTGPGTVGTLASLGYQYNLDRSVTQRRAVVAGESDRTDGYLYDTLDRLRGWSTTSAGQPARTTSFTHDAVGNIKTETIAVTGAPTRTVSYTYGRDVPGNPAPPHALISRDSAAYGYDAGGRQTTGDGRSLVYTMADLPKTITRDGQRTDLAYDATGARVRKSDAAQTTAYVPGLFERRRSTTAGNTRVENVHHIAVDGRVIAQVIREQDGPTGPVTATRTHYLHGDLQGSVTAVTGPAGRLAGGSLARQAYDPFGQRIDAVTSQPLAPARRDDPRLGYTQHEHDDDLGLINMVGRINDPAQRRFLTPDPVTAEPFSSQTNRYSYVRNNPTTLTDPTGFYYEESCASSVFNCGDASYGDSWANPWTRGVSTINSNNVGSMGWGPGAGPPTYLQPPSLLDGGTVIVHIPVVAAPRANVGNGADDDATKSASTTTQSGESVVGDFLQGAVDLLGQLAEDEPARVGKLGTLLKALDALVDVIGFVKSGAPDDPADGWLALLPDTVQETFDAFMDISGAASALKVLGHLANKAVGGGLAGAAGAAGGALATGINALARANVYATVAVAGFSAGLYLREKFDAWTGTHDLIEGIGIAAGRGYQALQEWTHSPTPLQRDILIPIREHYGLGPDVPMDISGIQDAINGIRSPAGGITIRFGN